jgi:hypothetical protein
VPGCTQRALDVRTIVRQSAREQWVDGLPTSWCCRTRWATPLRSGMAHIEGIRESLDQVLRVEYDERKLVHSVREYCASF